ncbi:multidrug effflux MFS transporter [Sphingomonas morindae]|uniref:Bcr/CflA family efflux transporter n=1 Tax=Sphingomonas morindae TaxID=1541170 RepID=A0ABY4X679_9SPHN|nr:multidrug effflux MFS transporter [Sphingomonas morindae]USI72413.1 multidrug effflux MFS transporter [Sphingomonas morindae]
MDQPSSAAAMKPHVEPGPHAGMGFREFVALIAAMMATNALAIDTMLPALPAIGGTLGVTDENARQWIVTAFLLGFGGAQILYGPLSDRFGRRPILLIGLGCYALFGAGTAMTPSFEMLLLFRVLQGIAVAATRVVTVSVVRDCYGGRQMARVMSLAFIIFIAVPVLAPTIGQLIMLIFPWRGLFWALSAYGAIVFLWMLLRLPETLHPEYRRPFALGQLAEAFRAALSNRQAVGYMLAQTAITGALFGFINSVQQIFSDVFHAPRLMPGTFAGIAGMIAIASMLNARIVERLGTRRVSHSALLGFVAIELVHAAIALGGHETLLSFAIAQGLTMFCFGLTVGNFGAMAMEPLARIAGMAASVQGFVSTVIGALVGFAIGQHFNGTTVPMTLGFAGAGLTALAIVLITERGRLFRPQMGR